MHAAFTCGEANRKDLIDAEFALNEGGGGRTEKAAQNYTFLATNAGGHSSVPRPDNAIYQLADAVMAVQAYDFPVRLIDTTQAFFAGTAPTLLPEMGNAIKTLLAACTTDGIAYSTWSRRMRSKL